MKFKIDRAFYARVFAVAAPIIVQQFITNFVSMLDNVMVGQVGTIPMSGVSIVNQLMFVFNLCVFGAMSGAGIFTAQFHGAKDAAGERDTFRFKVLIGIFLTVMGSVVFLLGGKTLIGLYLKGDGDAAAAALTMEYGWEYLLVMLVGLPPFALSFAYAGTLRETGEGRVPMIAGIAAVLVNLVGNYILIFGYFGAPQMGVLGAAVATVISRYVELAIVTLWTHRNADRCAFIRGDYRTLAIPGALMKRIIMKGMPLLVNEALWSIGIAFMNQCYSTRGLDVVAAFNISTTISQLSGVVFMSIGNAVGILMGQMLGAGLPEEQIRRDNGRMIRLSVLSCLGFAAALLALSGVFPKIYNTDESVRTIARGLIIVTALTMPIHAYTNAMYFTLRSGGQTFVTFLFDSGFSWAVSVPIAWALSRYTAMPIIPLYTVVSFADIIKVFIGGWMLKKGIWIRRIVA